ncbi:MAG: TIGR00730 family Rossman fold protein [Chitinophagia bacterium]|nr:TIGR00730 family Rossman fold protein [Chitinophagia bacterium]
MKSIAVFCGASSGHNSGYEAMAYSVGKAIAEAGMEVVYGAANVGLMAAVANGALSAGGKVTGVIPHFLMERELLHTAITPVITDTMHDRKLQMYSLSDCFIVLPGGLGTLDELFEIFTWYQLGIHRKPIALFNYNNYYDHLLRHFSTLATEGFTDSAIIDNLIVENSDINILLARLEERVANTIPATGNDIYGFSSL